MRFVEFLRAGFPCCELRSRGCGAHIPSMDASAMYHGVGANPSAEWREALATQLLHVLVGDGVGVRLPATATTLTTLHSEHELTEPVANSSAHAMYCDADYDVGGGKRRRVEPHNVARPPRGAETPVPRQVDSKKIPLRLSLVLLRLANYSPSVWTQVRASVTRRVRLLAAHVIGVPEAVAVVDELETALQRRASHDSSERISGCGGHGTCVDSGDDYARMLLATSMAADVREFRAFVSSRRCEIVSSHRGGVHAKHRVASAASSKRILSGEQLDGGMVATNSAVAQLGDALATSASDALSGTSSALRRVDDTPQELSRHDDHRDGATVHHTGGKEPLGRDGSACLEAQISLPTGRNEVGWVPMSESTVWSSTACFYAEAGASAFENDGPVPHAISNSRAHALNVARVVIALANDLGLGHGSSLTVIDIGSGTGVFAYHLTQLLRELDTTGVAFKVLLADLAPVDADYLTDKASPWHELIKEGLVDWVVMQPLGRDFASSTLAVSGRPVRDALSSVDAAVVTCNYVVDSCPADLFFRACASYHTFAFQLATGTVHEILTASSSSKSACRLECSESVALACSLEATAPSASLGDDAHHVARDENDADETITPPCFKITDMPVSMADRYINVEDDVAHGVSASLHIHDVAAANARAFTAVATAAPVGTGFAFYSGFLEMVRHVLVGLPGTCRGALVVTDKTCGPDDYRDPVEPPPGFDHHSSRCVSMAVDLSVLGVALSAAFPDNTPSEEVDHGTVVVVTPSFATAGGWHVAPQASNVFQSAVYPFCMREICARDDGAHTDISGRVSAVGSGGHAAGHRTCERTESGSSGHSHVSDVSDERSRGCGNHVAAAFADGFGTFATSDWEALCSLVQERDGEGGHRALLANPSIASGLLRLSAFDMDAFDDESLSGLVDALMNKIDDGITGHSTNDAALCGSAGAFDTTTEVGLLRHFVAVSLKARFCWAGEQDTVDLRAELARIVNIVR